MAHPDRYLLSLPHRPGLEDAPELALATGSLEVPSGVSYLGSDIEARASSVPSRSPSISAPSSFDGAASPWRSALGQNSPRNMSPTAKRKPEPINDPVTYTPTTHRVSKAKKGKKVHVCEFGCGKVFTRAEHRKRHEANHRKDPLYKCSVAGCEKPFQRVDLLNRHLERQHSMVIPNPSGVSPQRRASTTASGSGMQPSPHLGGVNQQLQQTPSPSLSNPAQAETLHGQYAYPPRSQMPQSAMPGPAVPHSIASSYGYSNPSGSQTQFYPPEMGYDAGAAQHPYWGYPSSMLYASPTDTMPSTESAGAPSYLQYRADFAGIDKSFAAPNPVDAGGAPINAVDPRSGGDVRSRDPAMAAGELVSLTEEATQHYEQCFWHFVDSNFQVLHPPSYFRQAQDGFLREVVCALGAQISPRAGAKLHSRAFAERVQLQNSQLEPETFVQQSALSTLQAVFLHEYFQLYRSTAPGIHKSPQFVALYNELQQTSESMQYDPGLEQDYERWIELESRQRLLAACFLLDTHRQQLFEQPATRAYSDQHALPIPRPCALPLWAAKDAAEWYAVKSHRQPALGVYPTFATQLDHAMSLHLVGTISPSAHVDPVAATVQLATLVPVRSLLVTASCSWLFARKVEENVWREAMQAMRVWAIDGENAPIAAWLAGKMLRTHFFPETAAAGGGALRSLETDWCLYLCALVLWAYTFPVGGNQPSGPPGPPYRSSTFSAPPSPHPPTPAPLQRADTLPAPGATSTEPTYLTQPPPQHTGAHRSLRPGPAPPPPTPLRRFLDSLATEAWPGVRPLRGHGGAACVLEAVTKAIGGDTAAGSGEGGGESGSEAGTQLGGGIAVPSSKVSPPVQPLAKRGKGKGKGKGKAKEETHPAAVSEPDAGSRQAAASAAATLATLATVGRARVVEERGALVGEAVGVLSRLRTGRGIWF